MGYKFTVWFSGVIAVAMLLSSFLLAALPGSASAAVFDDGFPFTSHLDARSQAKPGGAFRSFVVQLLCERQARFDGRLFRPLIDPEICNPTPPPPPDKPTVSLDANPTSINQGAQSTLTWSSTHADSCVASNGWSGAKPVNGTQVVTPAVTTTYTITCTGAGGTAADSATVTVVPVVQETTLTLVKTVVNDNGGTKVASDFQAHIDSADVSWGAAHAVSVGAHTASETGLAGYTAGSWGGDCAVNGSVTLASGEHKTCTITNNDQPGTLHVVKVLINDNGGSAATSSFSFQINSGAAVPFESDGRNDLTLNAGTYTITEPAMAGYTASFSNCSNVIIPNGGEATCTITNNDNAPQAGHLIVEKTTQPSGDPTIFSIIASGSGTITGGGAGEVSDATNKNYEVTPGTYSVSETVPEGWAIISTTCAGVVVGAGQTENCTITNAKKPTLTVTKVVTNDNGGTKHIPDFPLFIDGISVISGVTTTVATGTRVVSESPHAGYAATFSGDCDAGGNVALVPGDQKKCIITNDDNAPTTGHLIVQKTTQPSGDATVFNITASGGTITGGGAGTITDALNKDYEVEPGTFSVTETVPDGWIEVSNDCTNIVIAAGETKNCTITNSKKPTLTVVKTVINDNGGTKQVADFPLFIDGISVTSWATTTVATGTRAVSETNQTGYTATFGGDCDVNGNVTLVAGEHKQCTITNDDNAPVKATLTLVKNVIKNSGGTTTAAVWTLAASGPTPISGATGSGTVTNANVDPGTYDLSETGGPSGYTASLYSCVKNGGGAVDGNSISLAAGDTATCTITNDDQQGTLIVKKVIIRDNGNTTATTSFEFQVGGGTAQAFEVDGQNDILVDAGTYTVTEVATSSFSMTLDNCTAVFVPNGGTATCTITNDDVAVAPTTGHLIVEKTTQPGGDTTQFTINASGGVITGGGAGIVTDATNKDYEVAPGTYLVIETVPAGWVQLSNTCTGIVVAAGETKNCLITNAKMPTVAFLANPTTVHEGSLSDATTTLTWDSTNADSCVASNATGWTGAKSADGTEVVTPTATSAYQLDCTGPGGTVQATTTVTFVPSAPSVDHLLISEVFYNVDASHGAGTSNEWVELFNPTASVVNLSQWALADSIAFDKFPSGTTIPAGGFLVVTAASTTPAFWGNTPMVSFESPIGSGLANTGDSLSLLDITGATTTVDAMSYGTNTAVFTLPVVGAGHSSARSSLNVDTDTAGDWIDKVTPNPGQ